MSTNNDGSINHRHVLQRHPLQSHCTISLITGGVWCCCSHFEVDSYGNAISEDKKADEMKGGQCFQWNNPDFLVNNPDFLVKNPNFLLKHVDFIIKQQARRNDYAERSVQLYVIFD